MVQLHFRGGTLGHVLTQSASTHPAPALPQVGVRRADGGVLYYLIEVDEDGHPGQHESDTEKAEEVGDGVEDGPHCTRECVCTCVRRVCVGPLPRTWQSLPCWINRP